MSEKGRLIPFFIGNVYQEWKSATAARREAESERKNP
jgi:hypothetical protein